MTDVVKLRVMETDGENGDTKDDSEEVTDEATDGPFLVRDAESRMSKRYDHLLKMVVVGDSYCGKTSLLQRYVEDKYTETFMTTIGIDFKTKITKVKDRTVKVQIWDTAGQERYASIGDLFLRGTMGAVVCFDITCKKSFKNLERWIDKVKEHTEDECLQLAVVGCKSDLSSKREVTKDEGHEFAIQNGARYIEASAKENINVHETFDDLATAIMARQLGWEPDPRLSETRRQSQKSRNSFVRASRNSIRSIRRSIRRRSRKGRDSHGSEKPKDSPDAEEQTFLKRLSHVPQASCCVVS